MEPKSASEASTELRELQSAWWRALLAKEYKEAAVLADKIQTAAMSLRRATYITLDQAEYGNPKDPSQPSNNS